jgi:hypothetical protein
MAPGKVEGDTLTVPSKLEGDWWRSPTFPPSVIGAISSGIRCEERALPERMPIGIHVICRGGIRSATSGSADVYRSEHRGRIRSE